ncbi:unnamed protein product [Periconia digitata]|uniref:Uncharacterized protein n=1 Tax=Periconia digitata TaxID=1303443 RepID=A0A9W4UX82_9PLEO|nr:unnamed protein product [Periconia digitata]
MKSIWLSQLVPVITLFHTVCVRGDGKGMIGFGITMYDPPCAHACRNVIKSCRLSCTPEDTTANHGTSHQPIATPAKCFTTDPTFLRTMALCIDTYCPISDDPSLDVIHDFWASHLGPGTVGDYSNVPTASYEDALQAARGDETRLKNNGSMQHREGHHRRLKVRHGGHGEEEEDSTGDIGILDVSSSLPIIEGGDPLNVTSFIDPEEWRVWYNGLVNFEENEIGHVQYSLIITLVAILLPILIAAFTWIPGLTRSRPWLYVQTRLVYPAIFKGYHRVPVAGEIQPNRGQALFIILLSILNIIFLVAPYIIRQPQHNFPSRDEQELSIIGNRSGVLAMGNAVALFLFATRNNPLLYLTGWSHGTYLLLHRWLGYWTLFHTVLHSVMLLAYYKTYGTYSKEIVREYWIWGIVATVAAVAILPTSLLAVRQRFYEIFLASHVVLSLIFLIGYYYHIWFCYQHRWGYEIWAYIAGGVWGTDRVIRLCMVAIRRKRTAVISFVPDTDNEYLRIDVEGVSVADGTVYLYFPSLGWRFWENHPFTTALAAQSDDEAPATVDEKTGTATATASSTSTSSSSSPMRHTTTFFARTRTGMTSSLSARVLKSESARLSILMEGPYKHSGAASKLSHCSSILCIAGGIGITAQLPYLRHVPSDVPTKLYWSTRKAGLVNAIAPALQKLPSNVEVETLVSARVDIDAILEKELSIGVDAYSGTLGIVVCGPPEMADRVRQKSVQIAQDIANKRDFVLVDEVFSW